MPVWMMPNIVLSLIRLLRKRHRMEAVLNNAVWSSSAFQRLAGNSAATQQQVDNQRALVAQYKAGSIDQAAVEAAQVQLDYTTIRAH